MHSGRIISSLGGSVLLLRGSVKSFCRDIESICALNTFELDNNSGPFLSLIFEACKTPLVLSDDK